VKPNIKVGKKLLKNSSWKVFQPLPFHYTVWLYLINL